jgi:hypothetical protein
MNAIDENRNSRMGVTSFLFSIAAAISIAFGIVITVLSAPYVGNPRKGVTPAMMIADAAFILFLLFDIAGVVFGIISLTERQQKRFHGLLGLIIATAMFLCVAALTALASIVHRTT